MKLERKSRQKRVGCGVGHASVKQVAPGCTRKVLGPPSCLLHHCETVSNSPVFPPGLEPLWVPAWLEEKEEVGNCSSKDTANLVYTSGKTRRNESQEGTTSCDPWQNSWQGIAFLRLLDTTNSMQLENI